MHCSIFCWPLAIGTLACCGVTAFAQPSRRPVRVEAPSFTPQQFDGIFYPAPTRQLQGTPPLPSSQNASQAANQVGNSPNSSAVTQPGMTAGTAATEGADPDHWRQTISPTSLEDLIKAGKLRLDKLLTTPTAFRGGGFVDARTEFSLQALLFAIIEKYPGEVRWKNSAAEARRRMTRVAANTKVGSDQVFAEAKARLLDLDDLIGGTALTGRAEDGEGDVNWSTLIDRVPLMKLLEWAQDKNLNQLVANESQFQENTDAALRYAELIQVLAQIMLAEEMPDASDGDYTEMAHAMRDAAQQVALAAQTGNAELARSASGQIGQACIRCHDSFR